MTVYKRGLPSEEETGVEALAPELLEALGELTVDYPAFVAARVPVDEAEAVADLAWSLGNRARVGGDDLVQGYAGSMDLDDVSSRAEQWNGRGVEIAEVPGLFWVQFGYPVKAQWRETLRGCVSHVVLEAPARTVLVEAADAQAVADCGDLAGVLETVEPFRTIDRAAPTVLDYDGPVRIVLRRGVEVGDLGLEPGAPIEVIETGAGPQVQTHDLELVRDLFENSGVLALAEVPTGSPSPSDERQGLQVARSWDPATGDALVPGGGNPSYATWMPAELTGSTGQATIAFFDTGIDNKSLFGPPPNPQNAVSHPDIAARLSGRYNIVTNPAAIAQILPDETGHGSLTVSVAVGSGGAAGLGSDGFLKGQGIAPEARYRMVNTFEYASGFCTQSGTTPNDVINRVAAAHDWAAQAQTAPASDAATIANHSWNWSFLYDDWVVGGFDRAAIDAASPTGFQSLLPVVSAGNGNPANPGLVTSPAFAKNVVAVGSVDGWVGEFGVCVNPDPDINDDFDGPFKVSAFSKVGASFGPGNGVAFPRIKPDVVAPGWRVDGARPSLQECPSNAGLCGTTMDQTSGDYSYARGTSFAAPVVSGAAALKTKWFRNRGTEPKATLLKAALIATADSLGPVVNGEVVCYDPGPDPDPNADCRPSHKSGWGLVNLDRLTEASPTRFIRNEHINFDEVGDFWRSVFLTADDPAKPIFIVLVWNDIPNQTGVSATNLSLKRDLSLWVEDWIGSTPTSGFWAGNSFQENTVSLDTGWSQPFGFWNGAVADTVNTVEAVFIPPNAGYGGKDGFKIVVIDEAHPDSDPEEAFPLQSFSIYAWNAKQP